MRYGAEHKETTRARIVEAAAGLLRQKGFDGVTIPGLMKSLGLTHGGFYRHFDDRDALLSEAARVAAQETTDAVFEGQPDLEHTLNAYLSEGHVQHPEHGCVLAATGTDARRQPARVRTTFSHLATGFLQLLEQKTHPGCAPAARLSDDTLRLGAQMVGAVVLARLVKDKPLAARLLAAARHP
jgi:TetR/AcrR family transcriptional regulator, transcriptional repressor for nem operon